MARPPPAAKASMAMHRRITKELPQLQKKTLLQDGLEVDGNVPDLAALFAEAGSGTNGPPTTARGAQAQVPNFVVLMAGPRDSPYEGGVFRLRVAVPAGYPMEPPKIHFESRIFHPNVGRGHTPGAICLDILRKEAWSPALTLERTLLSIASLLADPNPASPMDGEAARLYTQNRSEYDRRVRDWVKKYASGKRTQAGETVGGAWEADMGKADDDDDKAAIPSGDLKLPEPPVPPREAAKPPVPPREATRSTTTVSAANGPPGSFAAAAAAAASLVFDVDESDDEGSAPTATTAPPPKRARV
eukprot:gnl/TRDRNA2_/TRDRNA2_187749_c0_seq1.p1 gnl/TRDRNA2_/TRDRNA2_187749_c0~~gnl/TRDRNA2_/TRDRNA2_187749_c0_seq1.p1  ORF type:complete len:302 (+),score=68.87 gnl/TRDRNA2_/TRDRNA2_187749_c0_seq1:63-968(+)